MIKYNRVFIVMMHWATKKVHGGEKEGGPGGGGLYWIIYSVFDHIKDIMF